MSEFISLTCKQCNGELNFLYEENLYQCTQCGTKYIRRNTSEEIEFEPIVDLAESLPKISKNYNPELDIDRLEKEINGLTEEKLLLEKELASFGSRTRAFLTRPLVIIGIITYIGSCIYLQFSTSIGVIFNENPVPWIVGVLILIGVFVWIYRTRNKPNEKLHKRLTDIDNLIGEKQQVIRANRRIIQKK